MIKIYFVDGTEQNIEGKLCDLDAYDSVFVIEESHKHTYINKRAVIKIEEFVDEPV